MEFPSHFMNKLVQQHKRFSRVCILGICVFGCREFHLWITFLELEILSELIRRVQLRSTEKSSRVEFCSIEGQTAIIIPLY